MTPKRNELTPNDIAKLLGIEGEYREALLQQQLKENYEAVMGKEFNQINNQTTKTMGPYSKELNYAFEFYHENGTLIDKIDGPGDIGNWLTVPDSEAPMYGAIIPVAFNLAPNKISTDRFIKAVRIPLDEAGNEVGVKEEIILLYADSLEDARKVASSCGCDFMYWTEWDGARNIMIVSVNKNTNPYQDPETETYYTYD